tara:strand:+ start:1664 stop:2083 length:420 start_codon:yes stop_codon:yes gene_type:complete
LIETFSRKPQNNLLLEDIRLFITQFSKLKDIYINNYSVEPHWDKNIRYLWIFRDLIDFSMSLYPISNGKLDFMNRGYVKNIVPVWSFYETDLNVLKRLTLVLFASLTVEERDEYINIRSQTRNTRSTHWGYLHPDSRDL